MDAKLTQLQMDALREVVSIGAGNAATALSQMVKKKVVIKVPRADILPLDKVADVFGGAEVLVASVYLELLGDATGVILFTLDNKEARRMAGLLLNKPQGRAGMLDELGRSAIKEMATILTGAYLSAISRFVKMRLLISSPSFVEDMAGAIIDNVLIETSKEADYFFVMDTELEIVGERLKTFFFFIPDLSSSQKILHSIGMNSGR